VTGPREILTRRRALASFGVLAGLTGMGCGSSKAGTPAVTVRPRPGTLLWRKSQPLVDGQSVLGVVLAGGVLCVGDEFGNIYGLDAATGKTLWRRTFSSNAAGYLPLAAAGGRMFAVGSMRVAALSAATGQQLWSVPAAGVEPSFPPQFPTYFVVCTNGVVCVLGADGDVAGLDPRTGRAIWRYPPRCPRVSPRAPQLTTASCTWPRSPPAASRRWTCGPAGRGGPRQLRRSPRRSWSWAA
jgi:outer membrane protein assembly factor BamB